MLKAIRNHWASSVVLGAFLMWMGWISLASYSAINLDDVSSVLHRRITSTKEELVVERDKEVAKLQKEIDRLQTLVDKMLLNECP